MPNLTLESGAFYSIQLQGVLDANWLEQYGDLRASTTHAGLGRALSITTVVGLVKDQAALAGLLNLAYSLGLPLLSVTYLGVAERTG